ncbi:NAD(P)-binding protein [Xylaria acuta]|nr:NAD(P)-binding protein [Xylaria acuta]
MFKIFSRAARQLHTYTYLLQPPIPPFSLVTSTKRPTSGDGLSQGHKHTHARTNTHSHAYLNPFLPSQITMTAPRVFTWLITGASSGFGESIASVALEEGHKVIGATRDVAKAQVANPGFAAKGGIWLQLDPAHPDSFNQFSKAQEEYDIDVLVNNAGYAFIGGVEDTSEQEVRDQMEVNFWGPLRAVQAVLPSMRAKGRGNIVLISSGAGFIARPGRGMYSASKFAIEAIHESLKQEVETLGIKVLIVEPGAFRTKFSLRLITPAAHVDGFSEGYKGTALDSMVTMSKGITELPPAQFVKGDPEKGAKHIVKAVVEGHDYLRMILGGDCVLALEQKLGQLNHDLEATRAIAMSTDTEIK